MVRLLVAVALEGRSDNARKRGGEHVKRWEARLRRGDRRVEVGFFFEQHPGPVDTHMRDEKLDPYPQFLFEKGL
jgi:hypothetical protein